VTDEPNSVTSVSNFAYWQVTELRHFRLGSVIRSAREKIAILLQDSLYGLRHLRRARLFESLFFKTSVLDSHSIFVIIALPAIVVEIAVTFSVLRAASVEPGEFPRAA
jgi:hypothetical protein